MKRLILQAFTLIELLVVIAIIGILSGLIVVSMSGVTSKATVAKGQVFSNSLRNSLMLNLISEWKLDDASGASTVDAWSGGNSGILSGFADTTAGYGDTHTSGWMSSSNCIAGTCLKLDGLDDYIDLGSNANLRFTTAMAYELWVKPAAISGSQDFVAKQGCYDIELKTNGKIIMALTTNEAWHFTQESNTALTANSWYHVVGQYDSLTNTAKIYINGVMDKADLTTSTGKIQSNVANVYLAYYNSSFPNRYGGIIDQVRAYDSPVPALKVKENYYAGLNSLLINGSISKEEYLNRFNELAIK